jgi:hypothetical protein
VPSAQEGEPPEQGRGLTHQAHEAPEAAVGQYGLPAIPEAVKFHVL